MTTSFDRTARVWDSGTGAELLVLSGLTDSVSWAAFSPDGTRIVTVTINGDRSATLWDALTGAEVLTLKTKSSGNSTISFSPDGSRILASDVMEAKIWDAWPFARVTADGADDKGPSTRVGP